VPKQLNPSSAVERPDERKPPRFSLIFKMREVAVEELGLEKAAGVKTA